MRCRPATTCSFVESDVYDAASALGGEQFDLVFTGIGALCWLPSISRWAAAVAALLKTGQTRGTYVETDVVFTANTTHEWNHGLGEIVTALIAQGLQITGLVEHDSVPWEALRGR